jgi:hypothetical protein
MYTSYFYVMVEALLPADRLALSPSRSIAQPVQHGTIGLINVPYIHESTTNSNLRLIGVTLLIKNRRDPQMPAVAGFFAMDYP